MITPARNVDLPERSTFLGGKAHRAFKKMPILSKLSRRLHNKLTTDAIPDPPRTESHVPNLSTTPDEELTKTESKSMPATPQKEQVVVDDTLSTQRQKSVPNDARPTTSTDFSTKSSEDLGDTRSTSESKEYKRSTKTKKYPKGTNIVITNSNGVNITNVKSYTCQVNQYSANNDAAQSETASKTSKLRPMPEDVQELSTCKEELGLDDMLIIKIHVGHGWRDIARKLLYLDGQIDQFEENFRHIGVDEIIYQLLLDWKQANTRDAQLGTLVSILWDCQEYDCVEQLAEARKNSS